MLDPIFVASLKVFTDFHANEFSSTSYDRNVFLAFIKCKLQLHLMAREQKKKKKEKKPEKGGRI